MQEGRVVVAIGVDTHKASLAACAIDATGRELSQGSFANSGAGHCAFERWLASLPHPRRIGIEGSGSYGAALAQRLRGASEDVREVPVALTARERRRSGRLGKCDPLDALAIARVALPEEGLPLVRDPRAHRDLKLLVDYRDQLIAEQTRVRNRLHSDLLLLAPGSPSQLGDLKTARGLRVARRELAALAGVAAELARLRIARLEALAGEIDQSKRSVERALADRHQALRSICGVGALTAARLLGETGDARRFRSPAAFAMACGVAPIPASSGKTQRMRLNRRGNRRLNRALFIVAFTQAREHAPARAYLKRKRLEGKSWKEAMRCLKRQLADVVYRAMLADSDARP
jgi:transposase